MTPLIRKGLAVLCLLMGLTRPMPALAHTTGEHAEVNHASAESPLCQLQPNAPFCQGETLEPHAARDYSGLTLESEQALVEWVEANGIGRNPNPTRTVAGTEHLVGRWDGPYEWPVIAVHATLMTNGKVLVYDSVGDGATEDFPNHTFTRAMVWDPADHSIVRVDSATGYNLFCAAHVNDANGNVFVAGGNLNAALDGIDKTHTFQPSTNTWTLEGTMLGGARWYPTLTALADGTMLITGGGPTLPEVRSTNGALRALTAANMEIAHSRLYHWLTLAPNGNVTYLGPNSTLYQLDTSGAGRWNVLGPSHIDNRSYGSFAPYDIGKALVSGGGVWNSSTVSIDLNSGRSTATSSMNYQRRQHNLTVLPTGEVLATGGFGNSPNDLVDLANGVYAAEVWSPDTQQWTILSSMDRTRQYHSTALLLPDGRILSAGGGMCGDCTLAGYHQRNAEIFSPPYLFKSDGSGELAARPEISESPDIQAYGGQFAVRSPQSAEIVKAALIKYGGVTHAVNMDQRYVPLTFKQIGQHLLIDAPANANIAPPGTYMLFLVDENGVPSVASTVLLNAAAPASDLTILSTLEQDIIALGQETTLDIDAAGGLEFHFSAGGLPPGMRIDPVTGVISGTPERADKFTVTVVVSDGDGNLATHTFTWHVRVPTAVSFVGASAEAMPTLLWAAVLLAATTATLLTSTRRRRA